MCVGVHECVALVRVLLSIIAALVEARVYYGQRVLGCCRLCCLASVRVDSQQAC